MPETKEYLSCEWIENRAVLDLTQIKFCCIPHSGNKGFVPMLDYQGGPLPVEEIREARQRLIEQNNSPGDSPCKGCHFLQRKKWKQRTADEPLFDQVYLSSFSICNLRCRYCFVFLFEGTETSNKAGYDLLEVFQEMIANGQLEDDAYIEWGGGEPTIVKNFAELEQLLLKQGYTQQVHTSAVKFSPELEEGLRLGKVRAVTSIDAGTPETYHKVKGRDRFDTVWEHVARYAATGGDMTVKYILRHDNSDEENVHSFVERCRRHGIKRVVLTPDFREIAQDQLTEETLYAFALMVDEAKKAGIEALIRDEYLKPADMKKATKYIGMPNWKEVYRRTRAEARERAEQERAEKERLQRAETDATHAATERAAALLRRPFRAAHPFQLPTGSHRDVPAEVLALFDRQTRLPDPALEERLTALARSEELPGRRVMDRVTGLGLSGDCWTVEGERGYLLVDAADSKKPLVQWVWVACYARPEDLPVRVRFTDGVREPVEYSFLRAERIRLPLPEVPAGESAIFACETDRTWVPGEHDTRALGVQVTTKL